MYSVICGKCKHFKVCFIARTLAEMGVLTNLKITDCLWFEEENKRGDLNDRR